MNIITIQDTKPPIKVWADNKKVEEGCLNQAINLAKLPMLHKHVALMADCHQGMGMPIGGVIGLHNVVIPNAVGVDIACGVCAVKSNLTYTPPKETREMIIKAFSRKIPVGFAGHKEPVDDSEMPNYELFKLKIAAIMIHDDTHCYSPIVGQEYNASKYKLGTLGGGKVDCLQVKRLKSKTNSEILSNRLGTPTHRTTGAKVMNHAERLSERTLNKRSDSLNSGIMSLIRNQRGKQK